MKRLSTLFLLLPLSLTLHAQWTSQPSGTTSNRNSVCAIDANTAVAVGSQGTVRRTTNGGTSWTAVTTGLTSHLNSVKFLNATAGMIVGDGQDILTTANGGTSWTSIGGGTTDLHEGTLLTASNGWVVGEQEVGFGFLYNPFTFDLRQPAAVSGKEIHGIWANSSTDAWLVGDGGLVMATTNGASWSAQTSNTTARLNKVAFSGNTGVAVGDGGVIIRTTNGGASWATVANGSTQNLLGVCFANTRFAFAVGASGTILISTDAGATWSAEPMGITSNLKSVHSAGGSVWACGDDGTMLKRTGATATKPREAELFTLHPNPATDRLTVAAGAPIQNIIVHTLLGDKVLEDRRVGQSITVNVEGLVPGLYLVEVRTASGVQVRRFRKG